MQRVSATIRNHDVFVGFEILRTDSALIVDADARYVVAALVAEFIDDSAESGANGSDTIDESTFG
jgi:hypothetical protein